MKIIVTGANGFIGHEMVKEFLRLGQKVYPVFRDSKIPLDNAQYCDLRDYNLTMKMVSKIVPDVVVHCAATSSIEECEKNKVNSWDNNVITTMNLIKSIRRDVHFVYLSSAEVFDGQIGSYEENSIRNPIHWYGKTKVASEDIVSSLAGTHTILRLSYQYGYDVKCKNFIHQALAKMILNQPVSAADDLIISPTYVHTTIAAVQEIILKQITGTYNIADREPLSKYQLISNLAQILNKSSLPIREKSTYTFLSKRPNNTSLNTSKFSDRFGSAKPLNQKDALTRFLEEFEKRYTPRA